MLNSFKCNNHGLQKQYLCIEQYCSIEDKLICKKCIHDHQHHLIVNNQQSIKMCSEYIQLKKQVHDDLLLISNNIANLRVNLMKELEFMELKIKEVIQQLKMKQQIESTIEKYLQVKNENTLTELEYQFIAQYLGQVSKKDHKDVKLDFDFKIQYEAAQYVESLLQNVQSKMQVLNPYRNIQKIDSKIQINQFMQLLKNEILTVKPNEIIVTTIQVLRNCKLIGFMQPCINGIDQMQEQTLLFTIHQGYNLLEFIYQQQLQLNHNQLNLINNQYFIKITPILLESNKEYTIALQSKTKVHLNQFYKSAIENPYLKFIKVLETDYKQIDQKVEIIINHGQFPILILETIVTK
ncbi:unnamed protein product [Paramecium sonneborni]|uniref:Uncharacterized protein n=1 Tax=Paramecium sonneborni TaxID=65129 RepID=A0A8S1KNK9_9CILI|nr:unnamed protein product [Paramecium sonneborni]